MRFFVSLLALGSILCAVGCAARQSSAPNTPHMNERRYKSLVKMAKEDLACEEVKYEYVGAEVHRMSGCARRADYFLRCPGGPVCSWIAAPLKQASFDLQCDEADLVGTRLSETSYGVEGCGKRMTYVMQDRAWTAQPASAAAGDTASSAAPVAADSQE